MHDGSWNGQATSACYGLSRTGAEAAVLRVARELTGAPAAALATDTPLMEAGVDSLAATELSLRLRSLTGVALSPTLLFEQPTPRAIAAHIVEHTTPCAELQSHALSADGENAARASSSLVGMVSRWPCGSNDTSTRVELQAACGDVVGSMHDARWIQL